MANPPPQGAGANARCEPLGPGPTGPTKQNPEDPGSTRQIGKQPQESHDTGSPENRAAREGLQRIKERES